MLDLVVRASGPALGVQCRDTVQSTGASLGRVKKLTDIKFCPLSAPVATLEVMVHGSGPGLGVQFADAVRRCPTVHLLECLMSWCMVQVLDLLFNVRTRFKYRHIPGPAPDGSAGHLRFLALSNVFDVYRMWWRQYGPVFVSYLGRQPVVVISGNACSCARMF